ncbi:tRNA pseudouridine(55) synthase TruB [Propionibacterium australiense]|uniref:tRNA pseudouridine synthase B n=1 Tax=Propionibacterium australiense TaxID=119981 RepID=A0A383S8X3_9ACTN|nr:tRNA pseudouridine(55) synthase TruB [Propionibacterium australiense]RLP11188.1 tRNA pseudouridine(55) synthase TruB [Propionibacterium australiense]RLP12665.1 tRNA pseudouridine(55) synthase TruB [Propionibacterium australiense]SYZ34002.1 tRNA pseudouridine55 synthase/tRNA pseudouridine38-40 synthase [Propionibacterium australiense]VEH91332.1 tRNA pseudouridine synthase B [Propionibacterium australiense]
MPAGPSGLVVIDKPAGLTSHQVVGRCRRLFSTRRVGHAGTLDPMATGVLLIGVNKATRLLGHLALNDKSYTATIRLGQATVTDDAEGETTGTADASWLGDAAIEEAVAALRGPIMQVPSAVSAIKVDGRRSYARVRGGEQVELAPRPVTVSEFTVLGRRDPDGLVDLDVVVSCSSGTYVRALARDLGAALGVGGHLTALRRTRIGGYRIEDAHVLPDPAEPGAAAPPLMSMAEAARLSFPVRGIDEGQRAAVSHGGFLPFAVPADPTGLIDPDGELVALYRPDGPDRSRPVAVLIDAGGR